MKFKKMAAKAAIVSTLALGAIGLAAGPALAGSLPPKAPGIEQCGPAPEGQRWVGRYLDADTGEWYCAASGPAMNVGGNQTLAPNR